jgi:hypothetical protein
LWAVFAFVLWNVVFDRKVYESAVHFTQEQIARQQRGEAVASIESAFMPEVAQAALTASAWGGAAFVGSLVLIALVDRRP